MDEYQNPVDDSEQVPSPLLIQIFNSPSMQQNNLESVQYIKSDFHLKSNSDYFEMLLKNSNENSTFRGLKICEMTNARTTKVFIPDISPGLIETVIKAISVESTMFKIIQNSHKPSFHDTPDLFYRVFEFFQLKSKCMNDLDMKVRENITRLNHESVFKIGNRFEQFSIDAKKRFEEEDAKIKENEAAAIRVQFQQSNARCYGNANVYYTSCFDDNLSSSENEHEDPFIEANDEDDWSDYENADDEMHDIDLEIDNEHFDGNQSDLENDDFEVHEDEVDEFHEEEINEPEDTDNDEYAGEFDDQEQSDDHAESNDHDMSDHLDEYDAEDESDAQDDSDVHDDSDAQEESDVFDESVDQFEIENDFEVHAEEVIEFNEEETDELPNTDIDDYAGESDDQEQSDDHAEYDDQNMSDHLDDFNDQIESDEYIDSDGEY